jgi:hypothetical protein
MRMIDRLGSFDPCATPSANDRYLRIAVVQCVIEVRQLSAHLGPTHTMNHDMPGGR